MQPEVTDLISFETLLIYCFGAGSALFPHVNLTRLSSQVGKEKKSTRPDGLEICDEICPHVLQIIE